MLIFPAAILGMAMASRIDLGVRHLLPIFLLAAAAGLLRRADLGGGHRLIAVFQSLGGHPPGAHSL
jgi:hypothetical protein